MKKIRRIVRNVHPHWVGDGFPVRSLLTYQDGEAYDPFLLLDYAGPYQFAPAEARRGVGEHPHRGFETVTIVYQGELEHRDSSGSSGKIGPGDVQWMTAASGVVHEELHTERFTREGGMFEAVQLWVNLPADKKMSTPHYQGLLDSQIPGVVLPGAAGRARVIAGEFGGVRGPAKTHTPVDLWDIQLEAGKALDLNFVEGRTALVVVQSGNGIVNGEAATAVELVEMERAGTQARIEAETPMRLLVLSGEPIQEPIVGQGPFVMNTKVQIREAMLDYQAGRMGHLAKT